LNELVRPFQAGAVLTQANPDLRPERARSADAALTIGEKRWHASFGGFWSVVEDAIANVTIQTSPTIIRQRRNTGEAVALGGEVDLDAQPWTYLRLRASATIVDARFRNSLEPALEGKRLPQVPRASVSVSGDVLIRPWLQVAAIYRYLSSQYDDDRNTFLLAPASQVDVRVFGRVHAFEWHVTIENGTDARIEVGRTPLVTLAPGRALRVGLIWRR
jgi:outer membrane receptor protein involved in Fe transport